MFRAADEFWDVAWSNLFEANQTKPQEGPMSLPEVVSRDEVGRSFRAGRRGPAPLREEITLD
jgi:hypothetical protein